MQLETEKQEVEESGCELSAAGFIASFSFVASSLFIQTSVTVQMIFTEFRGRFIHI